MTLLIFNQLGKLSNNPINFMTVLCINNNYYSDTYYNYYQKLHEFKSHDDNILRLSQGGERSEVLLITGNYACCACR